MDIADAVTLNPVRALHALGQSIWLDSISRRLIGSGELARLIANDGLRGVTSNPAIFEHAIRESRDYHASLEALESSDDQDAKTLYERLAIADVRDAADVLRPVYEASGHRDGYVSLEVSPYLAHRADETVDEARRLWHAVDRPNLMIKVPATSRGIPAIRQLIGEGINVNVTLLFSVEAYEQVATAYMAGLEAYVDSGLDRRRIGSVASVASFFVSRIDTAVDDIIRQRLAATHIDHYQRRVLEALLGTVAVANAKIAFESYRRIMASPRWARLAARGAQPQRLLWASTGTKNPAYSDVKYVEELIGPDTVNTVPPATLSAFRDHGTADATLTRGVDESHYIMETLGNIGISMTDVTDGLLADGLALFADAFDRLLGAVERRRASVLGSALNRDDFRLPEPLASEVSHALEEWRSNGNIRRLWGADAALWTGGDESRWLGWLRATTHELGRLDDLGALSEEVRSAGFTHAVLLGMGGSSLCPEVMRATFGSSPGFPRLHVLDSTDPRQIRECERSIDVLDTLFIVSSKSGSTLEPNILKDYFFNRVREAGLGDATGSRFIAVTDPGSSLEETARRDRFRHIYHGMPSIGGRYSALSAFGTVPAAVIGIDVERFLTSAERMVRSCGPHVPPSENPGVRLGIALGICARHGRDKLTFVTAPELSHLGAWVEQLIAESTGKQGTGIIPVDSETLADASSYDMDRSFVYVGIDGQVDDAVEQRLTTLEQTGHPVTRIDVGGPAALGQEFFRWEVATAVAGAILGINPFDQPDVEASKIATRQLTSEYESSGRLAHEAPFFVDDDVTLFADPLNALRLSDDVVGRTLVDYLRAHFDSLQSDDFFALLAYIAMTDEHRSALQRIRHLVRDKEQVATCLGFGPRFLHSTGQAYKGGPNTGVFLQITCDDAEDVAVPGRRYTFGVVKAAQARGDFHVLAERGRRALRVHLGTDVDAGLARLLTAVEQALEKRA